MHQEIIKEYEEYIQKMARIYFFGIGLSQRYVGIDDLEQAGYEGLIRAIPRVKPDAPQLQIKRFIRTRIKGSMLDEIRRMLPFSRSTSAKEFSMDSLENFHYDVPIENEKQWQDIIDCDIIFKKMQSESLKHCVDQLFFHEKQLNEVQCLQRNGKPYSPSWVCKFVQSGLQQLREDFLHV